MAADLSRFFESKIPNLNYFKRFYFLTKTEVDGVPYALCPFQGRLIVGIGNILRVYEIGKKKLLRKCESKSLPHNIVNVETQGNRIIISDAQESILIANYRHYDNQIVIFADDSCPRYITCSSVLDYDTIAGGDKFGNIFVNRLAGDISKEMDEDSTGNTSIFDRGYLNGAPNKLDHLVQFFVGETVSSVSKATLVPGGREILLYTTFLGAVGILIPFLSKSEADFFLMFEMAMRQECPPLSGRDHMAFRSFYLPVANTIDGDLCELYNTLPNEKKRLIAGQLDRTPSEVAKKIEDIRNRVAF
jgi:splicing factor 3B subunit 3